MCKLLGSDLFGLILSSLSLLVATAFLQRCYQDQGVQDQDQTKTSRQAETETETKTREAETKTKTKTNTRDRDLCCLGHDQHTQTVFIHRHLNIALQ